MTDDTEAIDAPDAADAADAPNPAEPNRGGNGSDERKGKPMRLVLVVNDVMTEKDNFTTIRLARRALRNGHTVRLVSIRDLTYEADETVSGLAAAPRGTGYASDADLLADIQAGDAARTQEVLTEADVMLLRADPADELPERPWAHPSSLLFAQIASARGVIVLNDPFKLTDATNKTYFQQYPAAVRPRTLISRDEGAIKAFVEAEGGRAVIKPLQGSGGRGVFLVHEASGPNINQMIEATVRDGYAIVQEYLPDAAKGDLRLITLNGEPLRVEGTYACFRRTNASEDVRSNISAGGGVAMAEPDANALRVAEIAAPKLKRDGMYLAGLDIVGDRMMEVNVDTPGGINMAEDMTGLDFSGAIVADLERKVRLRRHYGGALGHAEIAAM